MDMSGAMVLAGFGDPGVLQWRDVADLNIPPGA
jgi:hypothetical protein